MMRLAVRDFAGWFASAVVLVMVGGSAGAAPRLPDGFVRLAEIAPTISVDMRYATANNFTGAKVPGYVTNSCIVAEPVAKALAKVQGDLRPRGLSLKVLDCYRPKRAVASFVAWANSPDDSPQRRALYYPRLSKSDLIPLGYIAQHSSHSKGTAVDLTLIAIDGDGKPSPSVDVGGKGERGLCNAEPENRTTATIVDMGTGFDCFDVLSHTRSRDIPASARRNRMTLLRAMERRGFRNYQKEWWHFSMRVPGFEKAHDFPVE